MKTKHALCFCLVVWAAGPACKSERQVRSPVEDQLPAELERAAAADAAGDWATAQIHYRSYINAHPDTAAADYARIEIGRRETEAQRCDQALRWLDRAVKSKDRVLRVRAAVLRLRCVVQEGRHREALLDARPLFAERMSADERSALERSTLQAAKQTPHTLDAWLTMDALLTSDSGKGRVTRLEAEQVLGGDASNLSPADAQQARQSLDPRGTLWRWVAVRALADSIEARDSATSSELAASLRANGHEHDAEVQALLSRTDMWLEGTPHSIGVLLPLSGRGREIGQRILRGIELARGRAPGPQLIIEDTQGNPQVSAEAARRLMDDAGVMAVLGPVRSSTVVEAAKHAAPLELPVLAFSPDEKVVEEGESTFRLFHSPREEVRALVRQTRSAGVERFVVLHPDHGYGRAVSGLVQEEVAAAGGQTCPSIAYEPGTTSFIEPVRQLLEQDCQAVLLADRSAKVAVIAPTFAIEGAWSTAPGQLPESEEHRAIHFLLPGVAWSDDLVRRAGRYLQGALVAQPYMAEGTSNANAEFRAAFSAAHDRSPDAFSAAGYDAYRLVASAMGRGARTRGDLRDALTQGSEPALVTSIQGLAVSRAPRALPAVYRLVETTLVPTL